MEKITRCLFRHCCILILLNTVSLSFCWAQSNLSTLSFSSLNLSSSEKVVNHADEDIGYRLLTFNRNTGADESSSKLIPVSLWYPVAETSIDKKGKISFSDYVEGIKQDQAFADNKGLFTRMLNSFGAIDSTQKETLIDEFLDIEIPVYASPEYPQKPFPLVLICGGHPIYHTSLAESISRKGFVVASFPRMGIKKGERLPFNQQGGMEYQKDLAFVIDALSNFEFVDANQLSFVAWSFEGVPALETALLNKSTRLFASFDSSVGYAYGSSLSADSTIFQSVAVDFPLLHFTSSSMDYGKDLSLLLQMQKHNNTITIDDTIEITHAEFTSIGAVIINEVNKEKTNAFYDSIVEQLLEALQRTNG